MNPLPNSQADSPVIVIGDGPPLAAFPGLARGPVKSRLSYLGLAQATKRRVYVINRPLGLPRGLTMPDLAARHARILAERFAEPVDLIGASTGGAIALQLAVDHPTLVNRLVIVAAASWLGTEGRQKLRRYGDEVANGRSGAKVLASVLASPTWSWLMTPMLWASHKLENGASPDDMLATIDAEVGFDVTQQLNQIRSPTLLIAGGRDRAFPLSLVQATAAGIPGSRLIVYPKAGHVGTMIYRHFGRDVASFLNTPNSKPKLSEGA
jgi:pimeloyl-ACP methyl ester carboxylesterase